MQSTQIQDQAAFASLVTGSDREVPLRLRNTIENLEAILDGAEAQASDEGKRILKAGREMVSAQQIVVGSCWDFVDAMYAKAGYAMENRYITFRSEQAGPYIVDRSEIQPGDWMYFLNHAYHDSEHSGVFIAWVDEASQEAIVLSYPGMNRQAPGRYGIYQLSSVYNITRADPSTQLP